MMNSVFQSFLSASSALKRRKKSSSGRNFRRRKLAAASYEMLEQRTLMAVVTVGQPVYETIGTVGDRDHFEFTLASSTRVTFDTLATAEGVVWSLEGPAGVAVSSRPLVNDLSVLWGNYGQGRALDLIPGNYQLTIDAQGDATGAYAFRLLDLSSATSLTPGSLVQGSLNPATETDIYRFDVVAGNRFTIDTNAEQAGNASWNLLDPLGRPVINNNLGFDVSNQLLTMTGTYTLLVEGYYVDTGVIDYSVGVNLVDNTTLPDLNVGFALSLGAIRTSTLATATEIDRLTFTLTEPKRVYFDALKAEDGMQWTLEGPAGIEVQNRNFYEDWQYSNSNNVFDLIPGTYQIRVNSPAGVTGTYSFRVLDLSTATDLTLGTLRTGSLTNTVSGVQVASRTDVYKFNANKDDRIYFDSQIASAQNAAWRLLDPLGRTVPGVQGYLGGDLESVPLGLTGIYTLLVEGYFYDLGTVNYSFKVNEIPTAAPQSLTLGATVSGAITTPGQSTRYQFTITNPTPVYFDALLLANNLVWSLNGPSGSVFNSRPLDNEWFYGAANSILQPGSYELIIDGPSESIGPYAFRLLDLSAALPMPLDTVVNGTLATGRETVAYKFDVAADESYYFDSRSANVASASWRLLDPLGRVVPNSAVGLADDFEPPAFTVPGTYTLLVEGYLYDEAAVNFSFEAHKIPAPANSPLTLSEATPGAITRPGEKDVYTFSLSTAKSVYFDAISMAGQLVWTLSGPSGVVVANRGFDNDFLNGDAAINLISGDYSLTIDGVSSATGDYSFQLTEITGAPQLSLNTTITGSLPTGHESSVYSFNVLAGERFYFDSQTAAPGNTYWRILDPLGQSLSNTINSLGSDIESDAFTLPGTYTLLVEGYFYDTQNVDYSFRVHKLVEPAPASLVIGNTTSDAIAVKGEKDQYVFSLASASRLYFDVLNPGNSLTWTLQGPAGTAVSNRSLDTSNQILFYGVNSVLDLVSGDYTLTIDGSIDNTGSYSFRLFDLSAVATTLPVSTTVNSTLSPSGETDVYKFTATRGQRFTIDTNSVEPGNATWVLLDPLARPVPGVSNYLGSDVTNTTLQMTGTYTLLVEGFSQDSPNTISYSVAANLLGTGTVTNLNAGTTQALGTIRTSTIGAANEIDTYRFVLAAPTNLYFDALLGDGANWTLEGSEGLLANQIPFSNDFWQANGNLLNLQAGSYQLRIAGDVGAYSFRLLDLGAATPLTLGAVTSGTLANTINATNIASRTDAYSFTAAVGDRFFLDARTTSNIQGSGWRLVDPLGRSIPGLSNSLNGDMESNPVTLPGTYTLLVEGAYGATGSIPYSFAVHKIPVDTTLPLSLGSVTNGSFTIPGQQQHYTFTVATETLVVFNGLSSPDGIEFYLLGSSGVVASNLAFSSGYFGEYSNQFKLQPGEYIVTIDGAGEAIGNYSFRLIDVSSATPLDLGSTISGSLSPASEIDAYKFTANAGDRFYFDTQSLATQNAGWRLVDPLGRIVPAAVNSLSFDLEPDVLTLSGTYTLLVHGYFYDTGNINYAFNVLPIAPIVAVPLQIGVVTTGAIASAGEADVYSFELTESKSLYFDGLPSNDTLLWSLFGPAGYAVQNAYISGDQAPSFLNLIPGKYSLIVDGTNTTTGSYTFKLLDIAAATPIGLSTDVSGSLLPAQEVDAYKFTASAGDRLFFDSKSSDTQFAQWRLFDPFGNALGVAGLNQDFELGALPLDGTYTLLVEGYFYDTGSINYTFRINSIDFEPADTKLSSRTIAENEPIGFGIGLFATSDVDETSTQTYTLVSGDGGSDNSQFTLVGNQLKSAASFDFEARSSYSIRVQTTDNIGLKFDRIYNIRIDDVNEAPTNIALAGGSVEENRPVGSGVGSFATTDPDAANTHTYSLVAGTGDANNSSFTIDASGNLLTAASFNYEAKNSYSVRVRTTDQGSLSLEQVFTISVLNVNEAPEPVTDNYNVQEDVLLSVGSSEDLLQNDSDPENDVLVLTAVNGSSVFVGQTITLASSASLTVQADGQFTYDPRSAFNYLDSGESASETFEYSVSDDEFTSVSTVTISIAGVNDAPVAIAQAGSTNEDTALAITLAGMDVEDDVLTYIIASSPSKGTLTGSGANLTYTPNLNANGPDTFTFLVNDGSIDSQAVTVSINIAPVNDAPTAAGQSVSTDEDLAVIIALNSGDVDGDTLSFLMVSSPTLGTLSGTAPNLVYTPNLDVSGSDSFSYKVNDGEFDSEVVVVSITIASVNDAPQGDGQSLSVDADGSIAITLTGSDVDSTALTYRVVSNPGKGTLTGVAPDLVYTPGMFESGTDTFTFVVNDGLIDSTAVTVSIAINHVTYDFGDLANTFKTLLADNGPWHSIRGGLYLGAAVTGELNGRPSTAANLDAADDGVTLPSLIVPNFPAVTNVTASQAGRLDAFVDFNGNGQFEETERITPVDGAPLSAGSNTVNFFVPATATAGSRGARFRISTIGGLAPTGPAHDGEVEDYKLTIRIPALGTPQLLDDPMNHGKKMLFIRGTGGHDTIAVNSAVGGYQVQQNGVNRGVFNPTSQVVVFGLGGDDNIDLAGVTLPGFIDAGAGNDTVRGGNGNDTIFGRAGNDTIFGRGGDDTVYGGTGNDIINSDEGTGYLFGEVGNDLLTGNGILVGGSGNDTLNGVGARNLLIGGLGTDRITGANVNEGDIIVSGPTNFDADLNSLKLVAAEWNQDTDYSVRIANLDGSTVGGLNGTVNLNPLTVQYESSIDTITNFGSTAANKTDWVFLSARDRKANPAGVVVTIQPPATAARMSFAPINPDSMYDMNGDDLVSPIDALLVINVLNEGRMGTSLAKSAEPIREDVNGDGVVSPLDALLIINRLNRPFTPPIEIVEPEAVVDLVPGEDPQGTWSQGEGEGSDPHNYASNVDAIFDVYEDLVRTSKRKISI